MSIPVFVRCGCLVGISLGCCAIRAQKISCSLDCVLAERSDAANQEENWEQATAYYTNRQDPENTSR